jgi:Flp pilus assembly protein TadG
MAKTRRSRGSPREQGIITPILAACLAMGLGLLAMTVDLGQLFVAKNELQNIADAAALAGAKKLIQAKDPANQDLAAVYCSEAISTAQAVAADNKSFGATLTVSNADVTLGQWNLSTGSFNKTGCTTNPLDVTGIQVTVTRDGTENPSLTSFFGGLLGSPQMNSSATAVAYLGLAGTSSLDIPFAVSNNYPAGQTPYARSNPIMDWISPRPAHAANPQTYTWKDLGGSNLDTTRATWIMPLNGERTDLGKLQQYIKGPNTTGGLHYPQVTVGQTVYPISEWQWASNVYDNFTYLKTRYTSSKGSNNKWRVTVAVYKNTNPLAAAPPPVNRWLGLAQKLLPGPTAAYACTSYTSPVVYVQGFATIDITGVTCDSTCKNYSYPDSRSCYQTCSASVEVPLTSNFVSGDQSSTVNPAQRSYNDMNSGAGSVGTFASVPFLVK